MMVLKNLLLTHYKNYRSGQFGFSGKVTGICGANGIGKTNLLDAIYYLCFTKSYFAGSDAQLVHKGSQGFRIEGDFATQQATKANITAILRENGKKEFAWNGEAYTRLSGHIGKLPAVMIAPDDINIITGSSEERRKMADALLCQLNPEYMLQLMAYNKWVLQRNSLLKQMAEQGKKSDPVLDIIDEQMAAKGAYVYKVREQMLKPYLENAIKHYHLIAGSEEPLSLTYQSALNQPEAPADAEARFRLLLLNNRAKDLAVQRTTGGVHRDDLTFMLMDQPLKQIASQGQRKSLLFALKLTEFEMLQQHKGFAPILLLDDVFEKLDNQRMQNLLLEVCMEKQGQVFITDTDPQRLNANLTRIGADYETIVLE